ncbi:mitochondrial fission ELM1 family protein [Luteimonas qiangzhengi]|uniref:mitochondrial fission ELM1 family protein n=1 Tax=Luteimonas sp. MJ146 TaxID=3129240 RepID=UPI0031BAFA46
MDIEPQPSTYGTAWALTDGHAGNLRQALSLAAALGHDAVRNWRLTPRRPWRWAAPHRLPGAKHAFGSEFARALATPPALTIGCGRQSALATRLLRDAGARAVQILDPRMDPAHWDLVIAPEHDGLEGPNVLNLLGSLNPVDDAWLAAGRADFPLLAELPRPRIALLLGGNSRHARFDRAAFEALSQSISNVLADEGGSVLATVSRRTPAEVTAALRERMDSGDGPDKAWPGMAWTGQAGESNPYPGLLAWADRIVCTPDSVNMVSEACATRAPVFVFEPTGTEGRPRRFLDALLTRGRIRPVDEALARFDCEPLRETARIATQVRERIS